MHSIILALICDSCGPKIGWRARLRSPATNCNCQGCVSSKVSAEVKEIQRGPAAPCSPRLQAHLAAAVQRAGIRARYLPSGAGHDAVSFSGVTDIGMLFVRCGNGGVSHSPLETITAADADVATRILIDVLESFDGGASHGV